MGVLPFHFRFSVLEPISSRVLELEFGQYDEFRVQARTRFTPWRAEFEHINGTRHELEFEFEIEKNSTEPSSSKHYSLKLGSYTPLIPTPSQPQVPHKQSIELIIFRVHFGSRFDRWYKCTYVGGNIGLFDEPYDLDCLSFIKVETIVKKFEYQQDA